MTRLFVTGAAGPKADARAVDALRVRVMPPFSCDADKASLPCPVLSIGLSEITDRVGFRLLLRRRFEMLRMSGSFLLWMISSQKPSNQRS